MLLVRRISLSRAIREGASSGLEDLFFMKEQPRLLYKMNDILRKRQQVARLRDWWRAALTCQEDLSLLQSDLMRIARYLLMHPAELKSNKSDLKEMVEWLYVEMKEGVEKDDFEVFLRLFCKTNNLKMVQELWKKCNFALPVNVVRELADFFFHSPSADLNGKLTGDLNGIRDYCKKWEIKIPCFVFNLMISKAGHDSSAISELLEDMNASSVPLSAVTLNEVMKSTPCLIKMKKMYDWAISVRLYNPSTFVIYMSACLRHWQLNEIERTFHHDLPACSIKPRLKEFSILIYSHWLRKQYVCILQNIQTMKSVKIEFDCFVKKMYFDAVIHVKTRRLQKEDEDVLTKHPDLIPECSLQVLIKEWMTARNPISPLAIRKISSFYERRKEWADFIAFYKGLLDHGIWVERDMWIIVMRVLIASGRTNYFHQFLMECSSALDSCMLNECISLCLRQMPQIVPLVINLLSERSCEIQFPIAIEILNSYCSHKSIKVSQLLKTFRSFSKMGYFFDDSVMNPIVMKVMSVDKKEAKHILMELWQKGLAMSTQSIKTYQKLLIDSKSMEDMTMAIDTLSADTMDGYSAIYEFMIREGHEENIQKLQSINKSS